MLFFKDLAFFPVIGLTISGEISNKGISMKSLSNKPLWGIVRFLPSIISASYSKISRSMVLGLNLKALFLPSLFSISCSFFNNSSGSSSVFILTAKYVKFPCV